MFDALSTTSKTVSTATTGSLVGLGAGAGLALLSATKAEHFLGGPVQLMFAGAGIWFAGRLVGGDPIKQKSDASVSEITTEDWAMAVLPSAIGAGFLAIGLYRWMRHV